MILKDFYILMNRKNELLIEIETAILFSQFWTLVDASKSF